MAALTLFADVLQEYSSGKKTGALFVSGVETSENLIRFFFKDGGIYHLSYGPITGKDLLDILDCYNLEKVVLRSACPFVCSPPPLYQMPQPAGIVQIHLVDFQHIIFWQAYCKIISMDSETGCSRLIGGFDNPVSGGSINEEQGRRKQ